MPLQLPPAAVVLVCAPSPAPGTWIGCLPDPDRSAPPVGAAPSVPTAPPVAAPTAAVVLPPSGAGPVDVAVQAGAGTDVAGDAGSDPEGDITVTGRRRSRADPLEGVNAKSFAAAQLADRAFLGPAARTYARAPRPLRTGLRNFLYNLREPVVFVNYLLQLKPGKGAETAGRFAINTTLGVAGIVDVARRRPFGLPRRPNGFSDTLGYYGVGPGPFLFVPLVGPTTVRDLVGDGLDRLLLPVAVGSPFNRPAFTTSANVVRTLDHRAELDETLEDVRRAPDPYVARRELYLARRRAEIDHLRGRPPVAVPAVDDAASGPTASVAPGATEPSAAPIVAGELRGDAAPVSVPIV